MPETKAQTYRIEGLDCPDCAASLEKAVASHPDIAAAKLSFATSQLMVTPREDADTATVVRQISASMGYRAVSPDAVGDESVSGEGPWFAEKGRLLTTIAGGGLLILAFVLRLAALPSPLTNGLYITSIIVSGIPLARAAWGALRHARAIDMNVLMTIAGIGAIAVGEYAEGAMSLFLLSIGELLESYSTDRARRAVRTLMELAPDEATRLGDDGEVTVPIGSLAVGDRILLRPGERIPMDGRILEGRSAINQAPITGEATPVDKQPGDQVFAGTINGRGALVIQVTHLARDNTLARIIRLIEEAQAQRAPVQRFVDRFARVYTPIVVGLAVLIAFMPPLLGWGTLAEWVYRALVMLVISCPCALVISTPVTVVSALARAARAGILIKGGRYLEELAALRVVAFDKTGTLTRGEPRIVQAACSLGVQGGDCAICEDLLAKAASVEARSEHALAEAVLRHADDMGVAARYAAAQDVEAVTGMGIQGNVEGHTVSVGSHTFAHRNGECSAGLCADIDAAEQSGYSVLVVEDICCDRRCYFTVTDALRDDSQEVLQALKKLGIERTVMLTGDNVAAAKLIAAQAGVDAFQAGLLPEDKVAAIEALRERYGHVAMVGDGVNDAPAMAKATLGIAMGAAGTDTALETADIALMSDDLTRLPFAIRLGRTAQRVIWLNILFSLAIKLLFLALAVAGISTMWMAVLADTGASLLVSLNGLRLLALRERRPWAVGSAPVANASRRGN